MMINFWQSWSHISSLEKGNLSEEGLRTVQVWETGVFVKLLQTNVLKIE